MADGGPYDVVIVGAGVCGAIMARELGLAGKRVLILEAGPGVPDNRSEYMENFYMSPEKFPESPYPPLTLKPGEEPAPRPTIAGLNAWTDPNRSYLVQPPPPPDHGPTDIPFGSTYERVGGGTAWHWLGTSLRLVPHDLEMYTRYGVFGPAANWPIGYPELQALYGRAEAEIGVAASVAQQAPLGPAIGLTYPAGYEYPLPPIPPSVVDQAFTTGVQGMTIQEPGDSTGYPVFTSSTPAGRNSAPYQGRRVCAGNTNCIPICPIQAKWDATVPLAQALDTGNVQVVYRAVARTVQVDGSGRVSGIEYLTYQPNRPPDPKVPPQVARGAVFVLAAHAIENAKLLLNSRTSSLPQGVANSSGKVGLNLMDHVIYLSWALMPGSVYPYRGPLSTSGIESLRDGAFRAHRAAFRIEIGNEGWNFPIGDPYTTALDFVTGTNASQLNPGGKSLGGAALVSTLNDIFTRQVRLGFLLEQSPQESNRVTVDPGYVDGLGIPRPRIQYGFDPYTLRGFQAARSVSSQIYKRLGATEYTTFRCRESTPGYFEIPGDDTGPYVTFGAGHLMGTHRMGTDPSASVVNADQQSHDHSNLWIVGSGGFPTVSTPNPTLTIVALTFKTVDRIKAVLSS